MTITVRNLPTAYDPPEGGLSVATPSCCCCCCCCLATVSGTSMFLGTEAYFRASERPSSHGARGWAFLLGFASLIAPPLLLLVTVPDLLAVALVASPLLAGAVLVAVGTPKPDAIVIVTATLLVAAIAFGVELVLALLTFFILELTFPLTMWGGWAIARSRHRERVGRRTWEASMRQTATPPAAPDAMPERPDEPPPPATMT